MAPPVKFVPDGHRACVRCATSKAKCTPHDDGSGKCERCHRLQKECIARPRAQRKPRQAESSARQSRTAVLEERIEEIVALLSKKSRRPEVASTETPPDSPSASASDPTHTNTHTPYTDAMRSEPWTGPDLNIDDAVAEERLAEFRQNQAELCPFVKIPLTTSASALRQENPLLFCAVMMATSYRNWGAQKAIAQETLKCMAIQVFVQGRKSLALLQGLLVFLNWYHVNLMNNHQFSNLCHLAMAMATDLGLNHVIGNTIPQQFARSAARAVYGPSVATERDRRTLEERRALLGCFYLTSVISTCFSLLAPTPWSQSLQEACSELETRADSPGDLRLVALVRLQHLAAQIVQVHRELKHGDRPRAPVSLFVKPFEEELRVLLTTLSDDLREDTSILLHYHLTAIHLYSFGVTDTTQTSSFGAGPDLIAQHSIQHSCLSAVSAFNSALLNIPTRTFYALPVTVFSQFGCVVMAMARLKMCNPALVAESRLPMARISDLLDAFCGQLDSVNARYEAVGVPIADNILFTKWASWLRTFKAFDQALAPGFGGGGGGATPAASAAGATPGQADAVGAQDLAGLDVPMDWGGMFDDLSAFALFGMSDETLLGGVGMSWEVATPGM